MLYVSVEGVGIDKVYTCNDDLTGLAQITMEDPPIGQKQYSFATENMMALASGDAKKAVIYANNFQKLSETSFELLFIASICTTGSGVWFFIAAENNVNYLFSQAVSEVPVRLTALPEGYETVAVSKRLGKIVILSYKGKPVLTFEPIQRSLVETELIFKPKYGTGAACDGKGFIYFYNSKNELVKTDLALSTVYTPLWSVIGGDEYTPTGAPTVDYYGNVYCAVSEGYILKFSRDLEYIGKLPVSGANNVSHDAFLLDVDTLSGQSLVELGDVPLGYNNLEYEAQIGGTSIIPYVEVTADDGVIVSPDGIVWGVTAEFYDMDPAASNKIYVRLKAPGPAEFTKELEVQSCFMLDPYTVSLSGRGAPVSKITIPIEAYSSVAGSVDKRIMVRRIQPSVIEKQVDVEANFTT